MNITRNAKHSILVVLLFLNMLAWTAVVQGGEPGILRVYFFDVGQGDAIFMQSPKGHKILIDGGPNSRVLEKLSSKMPFWDRNIDLIVLTHPDKDHLAGLVEVLKVYQVENILWTGVLHDTFLYQEWIELLKHSQANIIIARAGQRIRFISEEKQSLYMDILYPIESVVGIKQKSVNESAIVGRLVFKDNIFLLTGDITFSIEKEMAELSMPLRSDILKVAHHGSKYSTDEIFLEKVLPEIAIIQVGKNSYGHPTQEVLERLEKFGISIFRNDLHGDITIFSDGENFNIKTEN